MASEAADRALGQMDELEAPHVRALADFIRAHDAALTPCYFMFFTSGNLHLVWAALRHLPPNAECRLIGSALQQEELEWVTTNVRPPFHHVVLPIDDKTIWETLFRTCDHEFAWLDIDCLVLDHAIFDDLGNARNPSTFIAGPFRRTPIPFVCTPLAMINGPAIAAVQEATGGTTPATYAFGLTRFGRHAPHAYSRVLSSEHRARLAQVLPTDRFGRPTGTQRGILQLFRDGTVLHLGEEASGAAAGGRVSAPSRVAIVFDTLILIQAMALTVGFRPGPIRDIEGTHVVNRELFHPAMSSLYRRLCRLPQYRRETPQTPRAPWELASAENSFAHDLLSLGRFCREFPLAGYETLLEGTLRYLGAFGTDADAVRSRFIGRLEAGGVDRDVVEEKELAARIEV